MVLHRTLPLKVTLYDTIIIVKTSPGGEKSEQPTVLSWNLTLLCFDMTETLSRTQIHKQLFSEFLGSSWQKCSHFHMEGGKLGSILKMKVVL